MPEERDAVVEIDSHESSSLSADSAWAISNLRATLTSGPIPTPETLAKYEEVVPGLAQTIIENWLQESRHRRTEDSFSRRAHWRNQSRGQIFGFISTVLFFAGSMVLIYQGHEAPGIAVLIGEITVLAGVFIFGKMKTPKVESLEKISKSREEPSTKE